MSVKLTLSLVFAVLAVAHCANILDFLNLEEAKKLIEPAAPELKNEELPSCKWKCKGPACACCIEKNITSYDPEGAKCVHMRYLSKDEGFFVQVSHGKKVDYEKIQPSNPEPLCLVLGVFFQMCATFNKMAVTADGLQGCVNLEPGTIFVSQRKIPLGCFKANESLMEMSDPPKETAVEPEESTDDNTEDGEDVEFDPNKFFAGVYQTAQQSIALLSSLLETPSSNSTSVKPVIPTESSSSTPPENPTESSQRRGPKNLKHPNLL
ncbi:uncharacterized protein LOC118273355 [Spodoptera frugiperda]|uniref:Uncharacterized protein LOC118273355 n=1 Tax=Spodoptera frugiperda TaxID=7108 RepID=A0A9R0ENS5_SPOFR|nr:uncharacterized protein LOC118273355 [Spodoptera frugiperda]